MIVALENCVAEYRREHGKPPAAIACSRETRQALFEDLDYPPTIVSEHNADQPGIPIYADHETELGLGTFGLLNESGARVWGVPGRPGCFGSFNF